MRIQWIRMLSTGGYKISPTRSIQETGFTIPVSYLRWNAILQVFYRNLTGHYSKYLHFIKIKLTPVRDSNFSYRSIWVKLNLTGTKLHFIVFKESLCFLLFFFQKIWPVESLNLIFHFTITKLRLTGLSCCYRSQIKYIPNQVESTAKSNLYLSVILNKNFSIL